MTLDRRAFAAGLTALPLLSAAPMALGAAPGARTGPFLLGADITWIPQDEADGAQFFAGGRRQDILAILGEAGFNAIKIRVFVNPENGYSERRKTDPWAGLAQTVAMAKRIKAAGMHLTISFHYSDNWADPQKQVKPAAWKSMPFDALVKAVGDHTRQVLGALVKAGAKPDMVVIGNEITFGMLWPDGRVPLPVPTGNPATDAVHLNVPDAGGFDNLARLLSAGLDASREAVPGVKTSLHNHLGRHWTIVSHWMDSLLARGVRFDATGFSCYQQAAEGDWANTFARFGERYRDHGFYVAEYSSRKRYVNDLVFDAPGQRGWGTFIWEPTRHQEAIFDQDGKNAGEGPRPNLLSQGVNAAEAPGAQIAGAPAPHPEKIDNGGRYDANAFMELYRQMARDYGLKRQPT
ncbi:arabinogalactan endo-1,4-beta-galactosidase [Caulobacter vibrioides]|nr:arabinogalactan endo-1,4-beta-galactosidase [Caulobacter vibrioides]